MDKMKKDFQKIVGLFRDSQAVRSAYPKAMMTGQQIMKGTATVNCDYGPGSKERAEAFVKFGPFNDWCVSYGVKSVKIESVKLWGDCLQWQVRVTY